MSFVYFVTGEIEYKDGRAGGGVRRVQDLRPVEAEDVISEGGQHRCLARHPDSVSSGRVRSKVGRVLRRQGGAATL